MGNTLLSGHFQNTQYWKCLLSNLILPLRVRPHVLSPVSSEFVEAIGHFGFSVSSTVENISSSRLGFACGVNCLFSLWLKYTVLRKCSLLLSLMIF